jgi:hypothetical protein
MSLRARKKLFSLAPWLNCSVGRSQNHRTQRSALARRDAGTAETDDDAPRIVRQAQSRSDKRAAQWTVERCQSAFRDWLHNAHSAAEIALITNVFGLGESDGDLIGNFLDHINLDRDKILGQDVPEQTKGRSAHA